MPGFKNRFTALNHWFLCFVAQAVWNEQSSLTSTNYSFTTQDSMVVVWKTMCLLDNVVVCGSPPRSIQMDDAGASHLDNARKDVTMPHTDCSALVARQRYVTGARLFIKAIARYADWLAGLLGSTVLESRQSK
jgi:hypothetical protein